MCDRDAVASARRSGSKVGTQSFKSGAVEERKIGRESSGLETDFRDVRDPCVLSYTHERNPSASNSERFLESPHFARSGTRREGLNLPTDNFPLNTAGKNGRPLVTIRPLLSLSLSFYLSIYLALSHCLSSILMDSFERVWRESPILKRDEGFPSRYEIFEGIFFFCCSEEDDSSNTFLSIFLNFSPWFIDTKFLIRSSKIIFFIGKIWNKAQSVINDEFNFISKKKIIFECIKKEKNLQNLNEYF